MKSLVRTVAPTIEPLTLAEAKFYLRIDSSDQDAEVALFLAGVRDEIEGFTGRALLTQEFRMRLSAWPCATCIDGVSRVLIPLDRTPIASVESIKYYPEDGSAQATLSTSLYRLNADAAPGLVEIDSEAILPELYARLDAVEIAFTAGAETAAGVPNDLRLAMMMILGNANDIRVRTVIGTINSELPAVGRILEANRVGGWLA